MGNKKAIAIILLAIAATLLVAESGAFTLQARRSGGSSFGVSYAGISPESVEAFSYTEMKSGYKAFVQYDNGEERILDIATRIQDISVDGSCWVPLYKKVTIHYSGSAECTENALDINYQGEFDYTIIGPCSPLAARRLARQWARREMERVMEASLDIVVERTQEESPDRGTAVSQ
jgi:hypothetical protein